MVDDIKTYKIIVVEKGLLNKKSSRVIVNNSGYSTLSKKEVFQGQGV